MREPEGHGKTPKENEAAKTRIWQANDDGLNGGREELELTWQWNKAKGSDAY